MYQEIVLLLTTLSIVLSLWLIARLEALLLACDSLRNQPLLSEIMNWQRANNTSIHDLQRSLTSLPDPPDLSPLYQALGEIRARLPPLPDPTTITLPPSPNPEHDPILLLQAIQNRLAAIEFTLPPRVSPVPWGPVDPSHTASAVLDLPETFFSPAPKPVSPASTTFVLPEPSTSLVVTPPGTYDPATTPTAGDWETAQVFPRFSAALAEAIKAHSPNKLSANKLTRPNHYKMTTSPASRGLLHTHTVSWSVNRQCYRFQQTNRQNATTFKDNWWKMLCNIYNDYE